jgi:drug/metabolite transporter (DMT)-like permease
MNPVGKLKILTGLQLAATLIAGLLAINLFGGRAQSATNHSVLWIAVIVFLVFAGCLGNFFYAIRRLPKKVCARAEAEDRAKTPWLSPEA